MTSGAGPRDRTRWLAAAVLVGAGATTFDRFGGERFHAPVSSIIVGPMIAAIACTPPVVALLVAAAAIVRFVVDKWDDRVSNAQMGFNSGMVLVLGSVAVIASIVRHQRDRELADARPAQRLTSFAAALAAARSVEEVREALERLAVNDLGARRVRFALAGDDLDVDPEPTATYSTPLVVANGTLGRVDIWFDEAPDADMVDVIAQGAAQASVALSRAQSARSLAVTARRLSALQRSTSQLAGLLRTDDIAAAMVVEARQAVQADRALLYVRDGESVRLAAAEGFSGAPPRWPITQRTPVTVAMRDGELIVHETRASADVAFPSSAIADLTGVSLDSEQSFVTVPIHGTDDVAAVLHLGFDHPHRVDEEERRLIVALMTLVGSAWRRAARFEQEERDRARSAHRAEQAARLTSLATSLANAQDRAAVAAAFTDHGLAAVDASWGAVFELDPTSDNLRVVAARSSGTLWVDGASVPLDRSLALASAVRDAGPVWMSTREEVLAAHPGEDVDPAQHARAAIPLFAYGEVTGVLGFAWDAPHRFDHTEIEFLQTIADRTGEALERARLHESERDDERRWSLLAQASARLSVALEPEEVLAALVRWAVPLVADTCTVYLAQPDGTARPYVAVDLPHAVRAAELFGMERIDLDSEHPIARLYRTRRTVLLEDLPSSTVDEAVGGDPARRELIRDASIRHAVAAPLLARNQQLGVLVLTMGRSGRSFRPGDVDLVSDLASRFSIVYDNAVLFATERNVAARLQAALLPTSIHPPQGLEVAVRYRAAGARAGGDWYDLISFGDDGAALVVGDLVGHGVEAAATMSRYRSALRAHARMHDEPAQVMNEYASFILRDEEEQTATVLYSRITLDREADAATLSYCSAGHPPPIVLVGGETHVLPSPQGPLIGLVASGYRTHTVSLPPGALLILYTDGLLERRRESLDQGLDRLRAAITTLPSGDLELFVDQLLVAMADDQHDDDVAVIVARVASLPRKAA